MIGNEQKIAINYGNMDEMARAAAAFTATRRRQRVAADTLAFFCVAIRKDVFEKAGLLDEQLHGGLLRGRRFLRRRAARPAIGLVICDDVFVHHHLSASFAQLARGEKAALMRKNRAMFEKKWGKWTPHRYRDEPGFGRIGGYVKSPAPGGRGASLVGSSSRQQAAVVASLVASGRSARLGVRRAGMLLMRGRPGRLRLAMRARSPPRGPRPGSGGRRRDGRRRLAPSRRETMWKLAPCGMRRRVFGDLDRRRRDQPTSPRPRRRRVSARASRISRLALMPALVAGQHGVGEETAWVREGVARA